MLIPLPVQKYSIAMLLALTGLLSGCAFNQDKQTLNAIQAMDANIHVRLQSLEAQNTEQAGQLQWLQDRLADTDKSLAQLKSDQKKIVSLMKQKKEEKVVPVKTVLPAQTNLDKVILGSREWVWLDAAQESFKARIDSGATTSSIHAVDQELFERNGNEWVRFKLSASSPRVSLDKTRVKTSAGREKGLEKGHKEASSQKERNQKERNQKEKSGEIESNQTDTGVIGDSQHSTEAGRAEANSIKVIEAPVVRWARIIQASSDKAERRPVIEVWIQVGGLREKAEFTLANRANMTYPILLGREFFKDVALIDVGKSYIHTKYQAPESTVEGAIDRIGAVDSTIDSASTIESISVNEKKDSHKNRKDTENKGVEDSKS